MKETILLLGLTAGLMLSSCGKPQTGTGQNAQQSPAASQPASPASGAPSPSEAGTPTSSGPHAVIRLQDGSRVPGVIVASTQTEMVLTGDDGIERKIPLNLVKSVDYGGTPAASAPPAPAKSAAKPPAQMARQADASPAPAPAPVAPPPPPPVTTKTYEVPAGSDISVRLNEGIDSSTAQPGQGFPAEVTRTVQDANGDVVIPRGAKAEVVIMSASSGGTFRGSSDLSLDLRSVVVDGKRYALHTSAIAQKGREGVGANKRTAEFTGGGGALGAIIGAIAGGGKGAAIGAGAGAGAGALTQVLTRGRTIKVPVESVLTFRLARPLRVTSE